MKYLPLLLLLSCTPVQQTSLRDRAWADTDTFSLYEKDVMLVVAQETQWLVDRSQQGPLSWEDSACRAHLVFLQRYARHLARMIDHP